MSESVGNLMPSGTSNSVLAAVQELINQSRALGLTWTLRMATVTTPSPLAVVYDGDTTVVSVVSMIGPLDVNQRIYVLLIPPSGSFVVGTTETSMSRGVLGINATDNGVVCTTPAGGAETAVPSAQWDSEPAYQLPNNRIFRATMSGFTIESTGAGGAVSFVRLRKGQQTTAGTVLGLKEVFHPNGFGGFTQSFCYDAWFKNTSGATVITQLSLTINGVVGGGTWSLSGLTGEPLVIVVQDLAWVADNTTFANTLNSV